MPEAFNKCQKAGGKIRTKDMGKDEYMHLWIPKGGGPSVPGYMKQKEGSKPMMHKKEMKQSGGADGRKYERG